MKTKIVDGSVSVKDFLKKNTAMVKVSGDNWFSGVYWFREVTILGKPCFEMHTFETMPKELFGKIKEHYKK